MDQLVADLDEKLAQAREGGGAKAAERMRSRGKKLPRERYRFFAPAVPFAFYWNTAGPAQARAIIRPPLALPRTFPPGCA